MITNKIPYKNSGVNKICQNYNKKTEAIASALISVDRSR